MFKAFFAVVAALLLIPIAATASPISYIYSGVGSGTFDGHAFIDDDFVITAEADTSNIGTWCCSPLQNTHSSATVSITGFGGPYDFLFPTHTWIQPGCCMGFGVNLGSNLLTIFDPAIVSVGYDLATDFGPVTTANASTQGQFVNRATSGGLLTISQLREVTFEARTVPEPTSLALLGLGLAGLGFSRRKQ